MFRSGNRWFSAASLTLAMVAGMHTMAHFAPEPTDFASKAVNMAMSLYKFDLASWSRPSMLDVLKGLNLTMSVMLAWAALASLVVASQAPPGGKLVKMICAVNVLALAGLVVVYGYYRVAPPLITLGVVEVLYVIAFVMMASGRQTSPK